MLHRHALRFRRADQGNTDRDDPHDEGQKYGSDRADQRLITLGELAELIGMAGRSGDDRLVVQESPDVGGHFRGRRIAALFFLGERFGGYRFNVTAQRGVDGTQPGGLQITNDAAHFGNGMAMQFIGQSIGK